MRIVQWLRMRFNLGLKSERFEGNLIGCGERIGHFLFMTIACRTSVVIHSPIEPGGFPWLAVWVLILAADIRAAPPACPADTLFSQLPDGSCAAGTSEEAPALRRFDDFSNVRGAITGVRWWGFDLRFVASQNRFADCVELDNTFDISLRADAAGAPGASICAYTLIATRTATGVFCGEGERATELNEYELLLPAACVLTRGWLEVVGRGDSQCWFLWANSAMGDHRSFCNGCSMARQETDFSFCLLGTVGGLTGACCDESTGICVGADIAGCAALGQRFVPGVSCIDLSPACAIVTGACCASSGSCAEVSEVACATSGGTWRGGGTACAECPPVGACCQGASHCSITEQPGCVSEGHTWLGAGTTCAQCPPLPRCDENQLLFGQAPADPFAEPDSLTSEASAGLAVFENFSGVAGPVERVRWWGLDLRRMGNAFVECTETHPTFVIAFASDGGGVPGPIVCSQIVTATRTPSNIRYHGAEMNEYEALLPSPCVLTRGWVQILGLGDPQCWFLWMTSQHGDRRSFCSGCAAPIVSNDLAVCLHGPIGGASGACCIDASGACADNVDIANCAGATQQFSPGESCDSLNPPCGTVTGACCLDFRTCGTMTLADCGGIGGHWLGPNSVCSSCPCIVSCPLHSTPEGEPACGPGYVDSFDAGCDRVPPHFRPLRYGDEICGIGGFFEGGGTNRDTDWYEITFSSPGFLDCEVSAEFPVQATILDGTAGCPGAPRQTRALSSCEVGVLSIAVNPGRYWIVVAGRTFNDISACGARYVLRIPRLPSCAPGDVLADGVIDGEDVQPFVECLLAGMTAAGDCLCADMDGYNGLTSDDVAAFATRLLGG